MGTLDEHTSLVELGAFMVIVGAGVGMVMQNLVLVVQNSRAARRDIGAGSSLIAFFRTLGGALGVSVLGACSPTASATRSPPAWPRAGIKAPAGDGGTLPDLDDAARPASRAVVEHAYGERHRRDLPGRRAARRSSP